MGASRTQATCQLYLVLEVQEATREHLAAILARLPVASVVFKPARGGGLAAATVKPLVDLAQGEHVAALLLDDVALARTLRADGVHLSAGDDVVQRAQDAREVLGGRAIVGADAGGSRHSAMELGEAGADYVAFGSAKLEAPPTENDQAGADVAGPFDRLGLVEWWSAVFEVPCVAFDVEDAGAASDLAYAGADFVAVAAPTGQPAAAVIDWLADISRVLERADA